MASAASLVALEAFTKASAAPIKKAALQAAPQSCGGWIRTNDLWVMSPTSYHCSTPRYFLGAKVLLTARKSKRIRKFFAFFNNYPLVKTVKS